MSRARLALVALLAGPGCSLLGLFETPPASDPDGDCPAPYRVCGEDCVDLDNDAENCGDCDLACRDDQICDGGCACRDGLRECEGSTGCVDLSSDPRHCGECGLACEGFCDGSECLDTCSMEGCLDGACVDFTNDPLHCGNCGTACAMDQICISGACRDYRPALSEDCASARCEEGEEVCCIAHTTEVCVTGLADTSECPE